MIRFKVKSIHYQKIHASRLLCLHTQLVRETKWLPYTPRFDTCYERWGRLESQLRNTVSIIQANWCRCLDASLAAVLCQPIVLWRTERGVRLLSENLDRCVGICFPDSFV